MSKQTVRTEKVTNKEIAETGAQAYELGREFGDFGDWYFSKRFPLRCELDLEMLEEIYNQGAESKAKETVYVNRLCVFIHGKTNTGKTYTSVEALKQMGYNHFYDIRGYGPAKFRNISTSVQAILLDNWTDGKYMSRFLELCGDKPVKITHREKNNQYFVGDVIVFEYLDKQGKVKGSKKQRLKLWRSQEVQRIVADKAHRLGMHVSHICAWNTSRLAFDGSGYVLRGKYGGFKTYELCRFQNGKIYNCDLSASYNIGARYFIRELLKSLDESSRLLIEANVPQCSKRSTCTFATLINLNAELMRNF